MRPTRQPRTPRGGSRLGRLLRRCLAPCLALVLGLPLAGCVDVDEAWAFSRDGSGTYELTLRWNADLYARVRDAVGAKTMAAFEGRAFPLKLDEWREGLKALPRVEVRRLDERDDAGGWHEMHAVLAFGNVEDLLGWEVLSRRTLRIDPPDDAKQVRVRMEPLTRLPVLDPLLAAEQARRAPPPAAEGEAAPRDPPPFQRLGLDEATVTLVERMLAPRLADVRFHVRLELAGRMRSASAPATKASGSTAEYLWRWADLAPGQARAIDVVYVPGEFDSVPLVDHHGDAPRADAAAVPR